MKILAYIILIPLIAVSAALYAVMLLGAGIMFLLSYLFNSLLEIVQEVTK